LERHSSYGKTPTSTWYRDLVTELPIIRDGKVQAPAGFGLGTSLRPEVKRHSGAAVSETGASLHG
jgi:galactonate dehydratase